jgi:cell fate regulator YaaT (PSP1 superfamily)
MSKISRLVNVRFFDQAHPGTFQVGNIEIMYGQKVVALSDRGRAIGVINSSPFDSSDIDQGVKYPNIIKIATDQDIEDCKKIYQEQRKAGDIFRDLVAQCGLKMKLDHFKYTSFGQNIIFYYKSPTRVDFRELLKSLRKHFSERIELCQISSSEHTAQSEKIGPCGMELCLFIKSTLKDPDLAARCSENKCCLDYKDPFYEDRLSRLPKVGDFIKTNSGEIGRVEKLDLVREQFELLTAGGVLKRYVGQMFKEKVDKRSISFPLEFDNISRETTNVIGLTKGSNEESL